jgi:hypothetical protein
MEITAAEQNVSNKDKWRWRLLAIQAGYYGVTGIWPLLHLPSFEAVTGPKTDDWLVHMVGLLAAAIGTVLGAATAQNRVRSPDVVLLAITSAAAFAAIDVWYGLSGRISRIYLADALVQVCIVAGLGFTRRTTGDKRSN